MGLRVFRVVHRGACRCCCAPVAAAAAGTRSGGARACARRRGPAPGSDAAPHAVRPAGSRTTGFPIRGSSGRGRFGSGFSVDATPAPVAARPTPRSPTAPRPLPPPGPSAWASAAAAILGARQRGRARFGFGFGFGLVEARRPWASRRGRLPTLTRRTRRRTGRRGDWAPWSASCRWGGVESSVAAAVPAGRRSRSCCGSCCGSAATRRWRQSPR